MSAFVEYGLGVERVLGKANLGVPVAPGIDYLMSAGRLVDSVRKRIRQTNAHYKLFVTRNAKRYMR